MSESDPSDRANAATESRDGVTLPLFAAKTRNVGTVFVEQISEDSLEVTYKVADPNWELLSTELYVGDAIPTDDGGDPAVDEFDHDSNHDPAVSTYTHEVDVSDLSGMTKIAAHATVQSEGESEDDADAGSASAWAGGARINQGTDAQGKPVGDWGMFFELDLD